MRDILTVLRDHNYIGQEGMRWDAADEIESLRAQLASASKALDEILFGTDIDEMRRTAGIALKDLP